MRNSITKTLGILLIFSSVPIFAQTTTQVGFKTHSVKIKEADIEYKFSFDLTSSAISRLDRASEYEKVFSITIDKLNQEKKSTGTYKALYQITSAVKDEKNDQLYEVLATQKSVVKNEIELPSRFDQKKVSLKYTFSENLNSLELRDVKQQFYFKAVEEADEANWFDF